MAKTLISLSAASLFDVLRKMRRTIESKADWRSKDSGIYTPTSCYGAVSHYIKQHPSVRANVMVFGSGQWVSHALLVTDDGDYLVNTVPGRVRKLADKIVFHQKDGQIHDLLYSGRVADFLSRS
jgi:hypothetical protein